MPDAHQFFGHYCAALLAYLSGSGESGLARAYELGRMGMDEGSGLLQVLRVHQKALDKILESTQSPDERLKAMNASEDFLEEALSTYDMASRGYLALLEAEDRPSRSH
jgi:hypothetical protein